MSRRPSSTRIFPAFARAGLALASVGLAGCADQLGPVARAYDPTFSRNEHRYAGAGNDLKVVVVGNPFAIPDKALAGEVVDAMARVLPGTTFALETPTSTSPYRVVYVFGPNPGISGTVACAATRAPTPGFTSAATAISPAVTPVPPAPGAPVVALAAPDGAAALASGTGNAAGTPFIAAFCRSDRAMSMVYGTTPPGTGASDPAFRQAIAQVGNYLFPLKNPEWDNDGPRGIIRVL